jgi:hypothetical protein
MSEALRRILFRPPPAARSSPFKGLLTHSLKAGHRTPKRGTRGVHGKTLSLTDSFCRGNWRRGWESNPRCALIKRNLLKILGDKRDRMDRRESLCTILYKNGFNLQGLSVIPRSNYAGPKTQKHRHPAKGRCYIKGFDDGKQFVIVISCANRPQFQLGKAILRIAQPRFPSCGLVYANEVSFEAVDRKRQSDHRCAVCACNSYPVVDVRSVALITGCLLSSVRE